MSPCCDMSSACGSVALGGSDGFCCLCSGWPSSVVALGGVTGLSPLPVPTVSALARLYGLEEELSEVARRGSGSACRSMFGGFVQWQRGERPDGTDSLALQVAPETHWPELRVLVLVVRGWQGI